MFGPTMNARVNINSRMKNKIAQVAGNPKFPPPGLDLIGGVALAVTAFFRHPVFAGNRV